MKRSADLEGSTKRFKKDHPEDRIDPVEKLLLLLLYHNQEWWNEIPESLGEVKEEYFPELEGLNYQQVVSEKVLRNYYLRMRKARLEDPQFTQLNYKEEPKLAAATRPTAKAPQAPFFRNVNFSQPKLLKLLMEDYFSYDEFDDLDDDGAAPKLPTETQAPQLPQIDLKKLSYYRGPGQLNLAAGDEEWYLPLPRSTETTEDYNKWFKRQNVASTQEVVAGGDLSIRDFFV